MVDITYRVAMERELRETRARSQVVLETAADAIVTLGEDGVIESFNRAAERMFGYGEAQIVGQNVAVLMASPVGVMRELLPAHDSPRAENGGGSAREIAGLREDGTVFPIDLSVAEAAMNGRRVFTAVMRDISRRKKEEQALLASEARNRALISAIPDPILTIGRHGRCLDVQASDPAALFVPKASILDRTIEEIFPQPLAAQFMQAIADAIDSGTLQELHFTFLVGDSRERHYEARIAPAHADTVICILRDMTDRERARRSLESHSARLSHQLAVSESDLREREQGLALAADAANLELWTYDFAADELTASARWRALLGFSPTERISRERVDQLIFVEDRPLFNESFDRAACRGGDYESIYRVGLPEGKTRWICARGRVEQDAAGQPVCLRGVSVDITRRKQAELDIEQKRAEVEYLSRLAMLGELSGSIAHELNQPLAAILLNAEAGQACLAQDGANAEELNEILRDIADSSTHAGEIIHRLRKMFATGKTPRQRVDVNELVSDAMQMLRTSLTNRGIALSTEFETGALPVDSDPVQIKQVIINLLMNASDAVAPLHAAERQVVVRTKSLSDASALVSVIDRGPGIPVGQLEKVFESFFTTKARGMGLGLSICRNIVRANGGQLWAENNHDCGASFHFVLPLPSQPVPDAV